jgi:hypothetical protein
MMETNTRNADLGSLVEMLRTQHVRKVDVVAPATAISARNGLIIVEGAEPVMDEDGVTVADGIYRPTGVMLDGIADKLKIPSAYLKRMQEMRPDLFDANVNGWLHGRPAPSARRAGGDGWEEVDPDKRSFLLRMFKGDDGEPGLGRAFLSDSYKVIDNLDTLMAVLQRIQDAGVNARVVGADLTDSRMYVRVQADEVRALAPELLKGYRSPFTGEFGDQNPVVFAGFVISNSEVGAGAFTITPRIVAQVCSNGMTITKDALRSVHLGRKLDTGVINWSAETQTKQVELVRSQTKDAVKTFLDVEYVKGAIATLETQAGKPVSHADTVVKSVAKSLSFSDEEAAGILDHFIQGGQLTAGGVMQAVTSYAQTVVDAEAAATLESQAVPAMLAVAGVER